MHILHLNQRNQILFQYSRDKKKKRRRGLRKKGVKIHPFDHPCIRACKFQFDPEHTDTYKFLATSKCSVGKQITNYQFICLFFYTDTLVTSELTLPFDVKM